MAETISLVLNVDTSAGKTAVKGLSDEVKGLKTSADTAKPAVEGVAKGTQDFSQKATQAKGAVAALAAAMSMVSPEAARIVQGLGNVAGALGGVGKAATLLGASAGPLALLTVAVGAVAVAWKVVGDNAKEAEAKQKAAAATATAMQNATNKVEASRAIDKFRSGKSTRSDAISEISAAGAQTPATEAAFGQVVLAQAAYDKALDTTDDARAQAAALKQAKANAARAVRDYATALVDGVAAEMRKDTPGRGSGGRGGGAGKPSTAPIDWAAGGITVDQTRSGLPGVEGISVNASTPWLGDPTTPITLPPPPAGGPGVFGRDVGNLGMGALSLAGGNVGGALASLGPAGAIVGGLGAIGQNGASGVRDQLTGFKDMMIEALEALPEILSEVIPEFINAIITEVIPALITQLPQIILGLITGLAEALNPFKKENSDGSSKGSGFWGKLFKGGGGFDIGTPQVSSDQMSMIHKDEAVLTVPEARQWRASGGGGGGGGGVTHVYNINGPVGDAAFGSIIEKQLSQRFGPGGTGYSTGLTGGLRGS